MPYRGRPSAGCQICRQRKIKCDRQEHGCHNCKKAGWTCGGYPDPINLIFHDESDNVASKVQAAQLATQTARQLIIHGKSQPLPATKNVHVIKCNLVNRTHSAKISVKLPYNVAPKLNPHDLAVGYFFHHYVHEFDNRRQSCYIEDSNGCLAASIKAVGLAGITRTPSGPSASPNAQQQYLNAIQLTNEALRSTDLAKLDSTLLAVNILGIYESISGFHRSMSSWRDHVNGATALLALRGTEQFETDTGGRLFAQTSSTLVVACRLQRLPVPEHVHTMTAIAEKHIPEPTDRFWRFYKIQLRYTDMYAKLSPQNHVYSLSDALSIINEALLIYDDIVEMTTTDLPAEWQFEVENSTDPSVFGGYYHVFPTYLHAAVWNGSLSIRIILLDIMIKAMREMQQHSTSFVPPAVEARVREAKETVTRHQLDICASIPQHLGTAYLKADSFKNTECLPSNMTSDDFIWKHFTTRDCNPWRSRRRRSPDLPFVRMSGGYLIQWSLFAVGLAGRPGSRSRAFAIDTLKYIGQTKGLQQALLLATTLEEDSGLKLAVYSSV